VADQLPSLDAYTEVLAAALPPGRALDASPDTALRGVLRALAAELRAADRWLQDLLEEADPRTTSALLEEWEQAWGLPDPCAGAPPDSLAGRRDELVVKVTTEPNLTAAFLVEAAAALGFAVAFDPTPFPFLDVVVPSVPVLPFRVGANRVGERLERLVTDERLLCVLQRIAPAHLTPRIVE